MGIGGPQARATRDIDFLGFLPGDSEAIGKAIREIGELKMPDGLLYEFSQLSSEQMTGNVDYPGIRFRFTARLGQALIPMQVDVGFGDVIVPGAKEMAFPTLLADMEPPIIKVYSLETIVAEKFEAALDLADLNSRMKDFYDLWIISQRNPFQGSQLRDAIWTTCLRRNTPVSANAEIFSPEFAAALDRQTQWGSFIRKGDLPEVPGHFITIMEDIRHFLLPLTQAIEKGNPFNLEWRPGGPWQEGSSNNLLND